MKKLLLTLMTLFFSCIINADQKFTGFMMPESVAEGPDGAVYVLRLVSGMSIKMARLVRLIEMGL